MNSIARFTLVVWIAALAAAGCDSRGPSSLVWDFTKGSTIDRVGWPKDNKSDAYEQYKDRNIKIILPNGKELSGDIFYFGCVSRGNNLNWVVIHFQDQNIVDAIARTKNLLAFFDADRRCYEMLDEWEWRRQGGHVERFQTSLHPAIRPTATVAITHDGKEGSVSVNIGFDPPPLEK